MAVILIVDPNAMNRRVLSYILSEANHVVVAAADALDTSDCVAVSRFDMAIVNVCPAMPESLELVRTLHMVDRLPILAISDSPEATLQHRATEAGARAFLTRPFKSHDLLRVVNWLVLRRQATERQPVAATLVAALAS